MPTEPTPAVNCVASMSAEPRASRAGSTASATTATCSSSTCATGYGVTQCVVERDGAQAFAAVEAAAPRKRRHRFRSGSSRGATTRSIDAISRPAHVEVRIARVCAVQSAAADVLPMQVVRRPGPTAKKRAFATAFLDLRRERRCSATSCCGRPSIASIRRRMIAQGFNEFQTPILTSSSSPEGARDFLVPSRHPPRQVLCPAAGAAAVQATDHGRRVRPLFPDRAVLSATKTPARTAVARRVLPTRRRDGVRHAGRRVRRHRTGAAWRVRGVRHAAGRAAAVSAHPLRRRDAEIRHRQARPAQPAPRSPMPRPPSPAPTSSCSPRRSRKGRWCAPFRRPGRPPGRGRSSIG